MANKKSYKKFAASAMAATAVVAAVAPSVVAADKEFTDIKPGDSHYEGVQFLVEKGIQGYEDGTFGVHKTLTRPHAAIMFQRALELDLPTVTGKVFNDVDKDHVYAQFIAAVKEAGIFKGSNGNFGINNDLTREQMATTLVNAFNLDEIEADKVTVKLDNVDASHKANVQILANLGITNQLDDFRPKEAVTRGQFATFLYKAHLAVSPIEVKSVQALTTLVDDDAGATLEFAINGNKKAANLEAVKKAGYKVEFQATSDIFVGKDGKPAMTSETGKLVDSLSTEKTYSYKVVVYDEEGKVVAESKLTTLNVEDLDTQFASIDSYVLKVGSLELENSTTVLAGETLSITGVEGTNKAGADEQVIGTYTIESSNPSVAYVDGTSVKAVKAGTTTITIKAGEATKQFTLTVSADKARVAADAKVEGTVKLTTGNESEVKVNVVDQFGEAFTGDVYLELPTVKVKNADVNLVKFVDPSTATLKVVDGKASFKVEGVNAGKGDIVISDKQEDGKKLATVAVDISDDVKVAKRVLEIVGGQSDDLVVDYYAVGSGDDIEEDKTVVLALNQYNAGGYYIGKEEITEATQTADKYTVQVVTDTDAEVEVSVNQITVTAGEKAGDVKIVVSYGATEIASKTVTVKNSTPEIKAVNFKSVDEITEADVKVNAATVLSIDSETNQVSNVTVTTGEKVYFADRILYVDKDGKAGFTEADGDIKVGELSWVADSALGVDTKNKQYTTVAEDKGNIIFTLSDAAGNTVESTSVAINVPKAD